MTWDEQQIDPEDRAEVSPLSGGTTSRYAIPYPIATDPVSAGAANMQAIAEAIDPKLGLVLLATATLPSVAATVDFTSIPQTPYTHLRILYTLRTTSAVYAEVFGYRFNNDSGANYNDPALNRTYIRSHYQYGIAGASKGGLDFSPGEIVIQNYANTALWKGAYSIGSAADNGGDTFQGQGGCAGIWKSAAAINRVTIFVPSGASFAAGSRAYLYGVL